MSAANPLYRIYCYDSAKKAVSSDWLDATTDDAAIAEAEARGYGTKCEIWDGSRLVAKLGDEQSQIIGRLRDDEGGDPPLGDPLPA